MSRIAPLLVLLALAVSLSACDSGDGGTGPADGGGDSRLTVVTSLGVFADMVEQIGGGRADVTALFPAGADPHTYEPKPRDVQKIIEADVVFVNGLSLEPGTIKLIDANLPAGTPLVRLAEVAADEGRVALRQFGEQGHLAAEEEETGEEDPHLWLSVDNAREYARTIRDALSKTDPDGAATYESNFEDYEARLDDLDAYAKEAVSAVPQGRRSLVTTHDAFGYMAGYLGFEVAAVVAVSPEQDPSADDIARLQRAIEEASVPAVFAEPQIGPESQILGQIAADVGVAVCTLYSDALDDRAPTYVEMMRFNADELVRCLGDGGGN